MHTNKTTGTPGVVQQLQSPVTTVLMRGSQGEVGVHSYLGHAQRDQAHMKQWLGIHPGDVWAAGLVTNPDTGHIVMVGSNDAELERNLRARLEATLPKTAR